MKITILRLKKYLREKRRGLNKINTELSKYPEIYSIFKEKNWCARVEDQICIWEKNPESSLRERNITVPEYELFRYLEEDSILDRFIAAFNALESHTRPNRTKYQQWKASKYRIFSQQVSQMYSTLFEVLVLGKLICSQANIEAYYGNVDGRMDIDGRYIYFEIKSLQKSRFDLSRIGASSTVHDKHQILTALKEKAGQLSPYAGQPSLIFLSLYRLADMTTGEWFINDFYLTIEAEIISGVAMYSWFTAGGGKNLLINARATNPLSSNEIAFLNANT